jgi:hypothetical protein
MSALSLPLGSFGIFGERATRDDRDYSDSDVASGPSSFRQGQGAGMRGGDVTGNIGEIPCRRDVNGRLAACQNRPRRQRKGLRTGLLNIRNALSAWGASELALDRIVKQRLDVGSDS